ncbi:glutenin, low molecular weight subunit-like [Strongylocentrotus purpuratus]|uniref:Uncharacterized protein n=1 Tax=Strongylocentrotus purpuratus TaxID=7668 RepID=A0A7M7NKX0_STRPU|nr:glutenin, low molecular weight subunit-like [Strongylocentrotus purpuratus]
MANLSYDTRHESSDDGNKTAYRGCVSKSIHVTGVLHIVAGALCIVYGISAIILQARVSYLGIPIWGGLLIFMVTGSIGVANYFNPTSKKIVKYYLVMSSISAVFAFLMIIAFGIFIDKEDHPWGTGRFICHPLMRSICGSEAESRIVVNAILILIFVLESLCGVVAASVACYKACQCCRDGYDTCRMCSLSKLCRLCRDDRGNSNIVYYAVNRGDTPMMAVPNNQSAGPVYFAGESSGTSTQPGQFMYLAPSPQHQSFMALPAVAQQNQPIPILPPPPKHQQPSQQQQQQPVVIHQQSGMVQLPSGLPAEQAGFIQVQAPGQMQPQGLAQTQPSPEQEPASQPQTSGMFQQFSGLPTGQPGFIQVQAPGQMQPQGLAQTQPSSEQEPASQPQTSGMFQQFSGLPTGQPGFVQVPAMGQMQPQGAPLTQQQASHPQPAGMVEQLRGPPQFGFFQVRGPGGQIQMIQAPLMYPQAMMAPTPQQPVATEEQVQQQPVSTEEQVQQQQTAPSNSAEAHTEEEGVAV